MKRFRAVIGGRVQGVGFRASATHQGRRLGIRGWASNRPDGTVEINAEGEETAMDSFLEYLRHGPAGARVKSVDVEWLPARADFGAFEVR